jgi:pyrimidine deaminase RibD-like protein
MNLSDFKIHSTNKLDNVLANCCDLILKKHAQDAEYYGKVAACVIDSDNNFVYGINTLTSDGTRIHAERAAINNYIKKYNKKPTNCIIVTTLSPCCEDMDERYGSSCTDLINELNIHKVYCGYEDPSQTNADAFLHKKFHLMETRNKKLRNLCKKIADTILKK